MSGFVGSLLRSIGKNHFQYLIWKVMYVNHDPNLLNHKHGFILPNACFVNSTMMSVNNGPNLLLSTNAYLYCQMYVP